MEPLTLNDTQRLLQDIQTLYTFHNLEIFSVNALTILNQLVPSNLPTFHATEVRTRQVSHSFLPNFSGFAPKTAQVIDRHFGEHPIIHHMPQTLHEAYQLSDFVSQKELHDLDLLLLEEQTLSLSKSLELLGLSQRETEVLFWVMQGKDNKAIAVHLSVCTSTVGKHLESIYRKLGVQSRTEAIAHALEKLGVPNSLPLS